MLIQLARTEGIPGIELASHAQVDEPIGLQCLPEIPGSVCRDVRAHLGYVFKLCLALGIELLPGKLTRFFSVPLGKMDNCPGDNMHGFQLLLLGVGFGIVQVVQVVHAPIDIQLKVQHSLSIDLVVQDGMAWRTLFHEFGKNTGLVGIFPPVSHFAKDQVAD